MPGCRWNCCGGLEIGGVVQTYLELSAYRPHITSVMNMSILSGQPGLIRTARSRVFQQSWPCSGRGVGPMQHASSMLAVCHSFGKNGDTKKCALVHAVTAANVTMSSSMKN